MPAGPDGEPWSSTSNKLLAPYRKTTSDVATRCRERCPRQQGRMDVPAALDSMQAAAGPDDFGASDHHPDQDASERGEPSRRGANAAVTRAPSFGRKWQRKNRSTVQRPSGLQTPTAP